MPEIKDSFKIGSKCIIVNDVDLRGDITIGSGCVLHPKCTIVAVAGPIVIGKNNILEENVVIVNRSKPVMTIGDANHFQVASRVESPSVGSNNVFEIRSRVACNVSVGSDCNIGAGCVVLTSPFSIAISETPVTSTSDLQSEPHTEGRDSEMATEQGDKPKEIAVETLEDYTQVFGAECRRRKWSGQGQAQARSFHSKHIDYLRDTLPKFNKLKMFT